MTAAEIVNELRSARPVAGDALRLRVEKIAAAGPVPARRAPLLPRLRPRRTLGFALAATSALALAAAGTIGFERSGDPQLSAVGGDASREAFQQETELAAPATGQAQDSAAKTPPAAGTTTGGPTTTPGRAERYSATMVLEVENTDALSKATQQALEITRSLGGHVVNVSYAAGEDGVATMTLRVPTAKTEDAVVRLSSLGTIVSQQVQIDDLQETLDAQDAEIVRLQERIARLSARLAEEDLTEETRRVLQARLDRARADLARVRAARAAVAREAANATITLTIRTPEGSAVTPVPSRLDRALDEAVEVLAWEGIAVLYGGIVAAPFLVVGAALWLGRRTVRRREDERLLAAS